MAANLDVKEELRTLLKESDLKGAIAFVRENKVALRTAITATPYFLVSCLLFLAQRSWEDHTQAAKTLWQEGNSEITSYLQWPPAEVLEDIMTLSQPHRDMFELLMECGQDVPIDTMKQCLRRPLMEQAIIFNNRPMIDALLKSGIDIDGRDSGSAPPLYIAAERNNQAMVNFLLDRGANVNSHDAAGETPLHAAVKENHFSTAQLLLEKGADVNKLRAFGTPPLHDAVANGNIEIVQLLLDKGADATIRDDMGKCAIDYANDPQIKCLLQEKVAQAAMGNKDERAPNNPQPSLPGSVGMSSNLNLVYRTLSRNTSDKPETKRSPSDDKRPGLGG